MNLRLKLLPLTLVLLIGAVIFTVFPSASDEEKSRLIDSADLLSESDRTVISSALDKLSEENSFDVVIATTGDTAGKSTQDYADDLYDLLDFGFGSNKDGVLMLIDMDNRMIWISGCGSGVSLFSEYVIDYVIDDFYDYIADAEYADACLAFIDSAERVLTDDLNIDADVTHSAEWVPEHNGYYNVSTNTESMASVILKRTGTALIIGFIIALIIVSVMKGQLKSVKPKYNAADYVRNGSFKLTASHDRFLYSNITKTPRAQSNSGSSHGGGRSGGGHISSSGRTHSGGGRRF